MRFTNKHNLPEAVFKALIKDTYSKGKAKYTSTSLLKSPRQLQLVTRHDDEIVKDCIDMLWSLLGTAVHNIFEEEVEDNAIAELRVYIKVLEQIIGGQLDHYKDGQISDYKCTSVWSWIFGSRIKEWTEQQNIYAELYRENGFDVNGLRIIAIFRDWKESEFIKNPTQYPPLPIMVINLEVWRPDQIRPFIEYRTRLHMANENVPDDDLPLCTEQEMWAKPTAFAVYKNKQVKAKKVKGLNSVEDAEQYIAACHPMDKKPATYRIEVRPGKRVRCEKYCDAAPFCNQYQQFLKEMKKDETTSVGEH